MESYQGVYKALKKDRSVYYRSSITFRNKHISLGSFTTPTLAQSCYFFAKKLLESNDLTIEDYDSDGLLSFEKWVSLINFRDHNYYFKNPIYMHKNYFSYYMSPNEELYFDIEDLFYYANHKILNRQGYYFVNDYGMQINILNRYGIRNHAVIHRDYQFVDQDYHNFRYDNLRILNPYYGVTSIGNNMKPLFKSKININGAYIIGKYKTLIEAAIAYNKTVDFLESHKISSKKFPTNYIDSLNKEQYKRIYESVSISQKIIQMIPKEDRTQDRLNKGDYFKP